MTIEVVLCPPRVRGSARLRYPDDGVLHLVAAEWTESLNTVERGTFDQLTVQDHTS